MGDDQKKSAVGIALFQEALQSSSLNGMAVLPGVKVKNTFINGFDDEETPRPELAMTHASTWAVPAGRHRLLSANGVTPTAAAPQMVSPVEEGREQDHEDEEEEAAAEQGPVVQSWASLSSPDASNGLGPYWGAPFGVAAAPAPASVYTAPVAVQESNAQLRLMMAQGGVPMAAAPSVAMVQAPVVAPAAQPRRAVQRQAVVQQPRVVARVAPQRRVVVQQQAHARPAAVAPPAPSGVITPLPHRKPEMSVGAEKHPGNCRPCAWFWKPQGCAHSTECGYCHMCPEGELKARKKEKASHLRDGPA